MARVRAGSDVRVFPEEAWNVCNRGADCRLVIIANRCKSCVRRKECRVQRTVDGEIAIMVKIEW